MERVKQSDQARKPGKRWLPYAALFILGFVMSLGLGVSLLTAPADTLGEGLRALSLSGGLGNLLCWLIWLALGALPLLGLRRYPLGSGWRAWLLPAMSLLTLLGLYLLINPALLLPGEVPEPALQPLISIYRSGVLLTWLMCLLLCLLLLQKVQGEAWQRLRWLATALALLTVLGMGAAAAQSIHQWQSLPPPGDAGLMDVMAQPYMLDGDMAQSPAQANPRWLWLRVELLLRLLPSLALLWMLDAAQGLIQSMAQERFSKLAQSQAQLLSRRAWTALLVSVLSAILLNLLAFLSAQALRRANFAFDLPLAQLLLSAVTLALAQVVQEGRRLKDENELFV